MLAWAVTAQTPQMQLLHLCLGLVGRAGTAAAERGMLVADPVVETMLWEYLQIPKQALRVVTAETEAMVETGLPAASSCIILCRLYPNPAPS